MKYNFLNNIFRSLLVVILTLSSIQTWAQYRLEASVSKTQATVGEVIQLEFSFNAKGGDFNAPKFSNVNLNGPFVSTSVQIVNGDYSANESYGYMIQPTKAGKIIIPSATLVYKGKTYVSKPIVLLVEGKSNNANSSKPTPTPSPTPSKTRNSKSKGIFIEAIPSKNSIFINEPFYITYKIYVNGQFRIQKENNIIFPKYNNFWSQTQDFDDEPWQQEIINGQVYLTKLFRKTILFPQKTGKLSISPLTLDLNIAYPSGEFDFFGDPEYEVARRQITSNDVNVQVSPLPEKGKPEDFTGAVGNFKFEVIIDENEIIAGDSFQMDFVITGEGNLKLFEIPKPNLPSTFEVYEPKHQEYINEGMNGMSGKIVDSYTIVPDKKGDFNLAQQKFTYFDVKTRTYKTITSQPITLEIKENKGTIIPQTKDEIEKDQEIISLKNNKEDTVFIPLKTKKFINSWWSLALLFIPIGIGLALLFVTKKDKEQNKTENSKFSTVTSSSLASKVSNPQEFYSQLYNEIAIWLNHYEIDIHASEQNWKEKLINNKNLIEHSSAIEQLINTCQVVKYAPITTVYPEKDLQKWLTISSKHTS